MTVEELLKIPKKDRIAALNADLKKRGRLYEDGGIFKSTDMIGVFNVIQKSMAEKSDQAEE